MPTLASKFCEPSRNRRGIELRRLAAGGLQRAAVEVRGEARLAEVVEGDGEVVGEHGGIHNFTVGQRKGLGVATGTPLYVIQIKGDARQVVVGGQDELYSSNLRVHRTNLISVDDLGEPMRVTVKIRHRHEGAAALIEKSGESEILVSFDQPQRAITPGQAAVFYADDVVVGGGWIA